MSFGGWLQVHRKTLAHQELVQAGGFAFNSADAEMPLLIGWVGAEILAADFAVVDQLGQLLPGFDAAGPRVSVLVDAHLVKRRRIYTVEPVDHIGELKGASIPDGRAGGHGLVRQKKGLAR